MPTTLPSGRRWASRTCPNVRACVRRAGASGDLKLGLRDLFGKRDKVFDGTATGKLYRPVFEAKLKAIEELPPALTGARPLADELAAEDALHDGIGAAVWHMTEAYIRHVGLDPELRESAQRVRQTFIPSLSDLREPYADEAAAAMRRVEDVAPLKAALKRFPVAGRKTLFDWVGSFLEQGRKIDDLLSQRGEPQAGAAGGSRKGAAALRASTIAVLNRARAALADELGSNPALPQDLDTQIFGYFDELARLRAEQGTSTPAATATPPPPPPDRPKS